MKLGIITDEVTQDINEAVRFSKNHKLNGVELRSVDDTPIDLIKSDRIKEIGKILNSQNLEVCSLSSSFFKCSINDDKMYLENIEKLKRLIDTAHTLNCKYIRGFTFFSEGNFEENVSRIVEKFQKPLSILKDQGVMLLLEADPGVFTTNLRKLSIIIKSLNSSIIGAIYDPGNEIYDPDGEKPYPEGYEYIKKYIKHVHVKDAAIIEGKPQSLKIGTGEVPYGDILRRLKESNYDGYVVLETHYRISSKIPENLMRIPQGKLFSLNGQEASNESMIELKKLVEQIA